MKKPSMRLLIAFVVFTVLRFLLPLLLEWIIISSGDVGEREAFLYYALSALILYAVCFPVYLAITGCKPSELRGFFAVERKLSPKRFFRFFLILCASGLWVLPFSLHSSPPPELVSYDILQLLLLVTITPLMEEIMFRGVALERLACMGRQNALFFSALIFAIGHGDLFSAFLAMLPGILLGCVALETGGLRYCIPLHMLFNLVGNTLPLLAGLSAVGLVFAMVIAIALVAGGLLFVIRYAREKEPLL